MKLSFVKIWRTLKRFIPFAHCECRGKYGMFTLPPISCDEFIKRLTPLGFQYNYFSYHDKDQVCNVRKTYLAGSGPEIWQHHLRLYNDGEVRGHDEIAYESDAISHEKGTTLSVISIEDIDKYLKALTNEKHKSYKD